MKAKNKNHKVVDKDIAALEKAHDKDFKIRITTFIDLDIYNELKRIAGDKHTKYQTFLNTFLREKLLGEVDEIEAIKRRLKQIEEKVEAKIA